MEKNEKITVGKKKMHHSSRQIDYKRVYQEKKVLESNELNNDLQEFLEFKNIPDIESNRNSLRIYLLEMKVFDPNYTLYDITDGELIDIINDSSEEKKEIDNVEKWQENKSQAQTAETFVDNWKNEGFSNYEVLQKLLKAHEDEEIRMLSKKYEQFKGFLSLLQKHVFAGDTAKIITVINQSGIDLSNPKAFDQLVFAIFEDESISQATKDKLNKQFKLRPITVGEDIRDNLIFRQNQITERKEQRISVKKTIAILSKQISVTRKRLKELKESLLVESDLEKRIEMEKQYDELEGLLTRLEKDAEKNRKLKKELDINFSDVVFVRGAEAKFVGEDILISFPKTGIQVSVPSNMPSKAIAKVANSLLVFQVSQPFGLEHYFFETTDFIDGNYPYQPTLNRNNLFLFRLGLSSDGIILKTSEIKELRKYLALLFPYNKKRSNLTLQENASQRLNELGLLKGSNIDDELFVEKINRIKVFGKLAA